jgi:hypothetical protein
MQNAPTGAYPKTYPKSWRPLHRRVAVCDRDSAAHRGDSEGSKLPSTHAKARHRGRAMNIPGGPGKSEVLRSSLSPTPNVFASPLRGTGMLVPAPDAARPWHSQGGFRLPISWTELRVPLLPITGLLGSQSARLTVLP